MRKVSIYTDGSCLGNPGPGGWCALLKFGTQERIIRGCMKCATNNQMELTAALNGLEALKFPCEVSIYTDSNYLRQGMTQWVKHWQKNNWKTATKAPVKNKEIWLKLIELAKQHTVHWYWVKAHNGNPNNERVDQLARLAAETQSYE